MSKEFEVTIRIRNNLLKSRRIALGLGSVALAEQVGISPTTYCALEGLKLAPVCKQKFGKPGLVWRDVVRRLAEFHKCMPEDLFPDAVLAVTCPEVSREVSAAELCPLLASQQAESIAALPAPNPEAALEAEELSGALRTALDSLPPRERHVVRKRFDECLTFEEIGKELGLGRERIRQIEARALRRLRDYCRLKEARTSERRPVHDHPHPRH